MRVHRWLLTTALLVSFAVPPAAGQRERESQQTAETVRALDARVQRIEGVLGSMRTAISSVEAKVVDLASQSGGSGGDAATENAKAIEALAEQVDALDTRIDQVLAYVQNSVQNYVPSSPPTQASAQNAQAIAALEAVVESLDTRVDGVEAGVGSVTADAAGMDGRLTALEAYYGAIGPNMGYGANLSEHLDSLYSQHVLKSQRLNSHASFLIELHPMLVEWKSVLEELRGTPLLYSVPSHQGISQY
jgi:prefoldin subunit 5